MRTPPANWATIMSQPHETETRIDIAGTSYYGFDGNSGIYSCTTHPMLFDKMSVGNCCSSQIDLTLVSPQNIPRMAQMDLYVRLTNGTLTTGWVQKGTYFIDTREWDAQHEFLTITGYDAMLKAEQYYYTPPTTITGWPKTDTAVVTEICQRIGVQLDSRTTLNKGYKVRMPSVSSDGKGSNTLREVLKWIGAAYGGNWCITDEGKLRLVPLVPTNTPIAIGTDAIDLNTSPQYEGIGIVHLIVGEDGEEYTAGSTGREIEVDAHGMHFENEQAGRTMAANVLSALQGYAYQPLTVTTAFEADPLWELGDKITVNGFTSQIAEMPTDLGLKYTVDITAGGEDEIDHEYPFQSTEKQIERKIASSVASIKIDIDSIDSRVTSAEGTIAAHTISIGQIRSEVSGKITTYRQPTVPTGAHNGDLWYCTGTPTGYTANTWYRYNGTSWDKSSEDIDIPVAPAWASGTPYTKGDVVEDGGAWYSAKSNHTASASNKPPNSTYWNANATISAVTKSQIDQLADSISLSVNQSSLVLTGNGISITAPTANLKVDAANITGTLTVGWNNVSGKPSFASVATSGSYNDLSNKPSIPTDSHITTITGNYIATASIYAQNLEVNAANINGTLSADQISTDIAEVASDLYIGGSGYRYTGTLHLNRYCYIEANRNEDMILSAGSSMELGAYYDINMYAEGLYFNGDPIEPSDANVKTDISYDVSAYDAIFDKLKPVSFKFVEGSSGRTHTGLIAQDVKAAVEACGMETTDFAAYCFWHRDDGDHHGIRYGELISLCIDQIQRLKARVTELEANNG